MAVGQNSQGLADSKDTPVFKDDVKKAADIFYFDSYSPIKFAWTNWRSLDDVVRWIEAWLNCWDQREEA